MNLIAKIRILLKLQNLWNTITEAKMDNSVKPGWKTTEFWGKIAIQVFTIWGMAKGMVSPEKAALITAALEGVYSVARAVVKYKGGTLPDERTA